jgi:peptide/nickel transport system ATP-binding protein
MQLTMTAWSISEVTKCYRTNWLRGGGDLALDRVSFDASGARITAVVGESGSGKSTLARCMIGLLPIESGSITFGGFDVGKANRRMLREHRRRVQLVPQDPGAALNPRMTVGDLLSEALLAHGLAARRSVGGVVAGLLDQVRLPARMANARPHELSGGQKQRVCIARALALEPNYLIADECLAALDPSTQIEIVELLLTLVGTRRMGMLFISHDLNMVRAIAEDVIVLLKGSVVDKGATNAVFGAPRVPYVRQLLASVS